jgi:uncharacterized membrane protein
MMTMENESEINMKPMIFWGVGLFLLTVLVSLYAWFTLPAGAQIATHWGLEGRADGWSDKTMGLAIIPIMELVVIGVYLFALRFMPRRENIARSLGAIRIVVLLSLVVTFLAQLLIVLTALGTKVDVSAASQILVGITFIVVGNFLGKIRSNFLTGIRTPWTLSSELSWEKTNRLAGKLFVTAGIIMILGKWMNDMMMWIGLMATELIIIMIICYVFSYKIWQLDPSKHAELYTDQEDADSLLKTQMREGMITKTTIMLLIVAFAIFFTAGVANKPAPELEKAGVSFVQNVTQGKFAEAEQLFDDTMKNALPPEKLQETWAAVETDKGKFIKQTDVRSSSMWPYRMVYVGCQFERARMLVKVVFGKSGKITGLWISPG